MIGSVIGSMIGPVISPASPLKGVLAAATLFAATACSSDAPEPTPDPTASADAEAGAQAASPTAPATATEVPAPPSRRCYALTFDDAIAATSDAEPVPCADEHTTITYRVGELDSVRAGHLLAVDSETLQSQVAERCPEALGDFIGGSEDDRRLSVLRSVWFTPTVEESDTGANWFRCDVVALAGSGELAPLAGRLQGTLDRDAGRDRWGLCSPAEPGTDAFSRVPCSQPHDWRAVEVVGLGSGDYPGEQQVRSAGEGPCEDAGRAAADDPLEFDWGYEWPTAEQWDAGRTYGVCWVPEA